MTEDERARYVAELARMGQPEEVRELFKRLVALGEIGDTAEDFRRFIRGIGSPAQVAKRRDDVDQLMETQRFYSRVFSSLRVVAIWTAAMAAGWLAFKGIISDFLRGLQ